MSRKDQGKGMSQGISLEFQEKLTDEIEARRRAKEAMAAKRRTRTPKMRQSPEEMPPARHPVD